MNDKLTIEQEMRNEFDTITDLDEAKRCLKIAYRQGLNMYHGRCIWMMISAFLALTVAWMYYAR